MAEMVIQFFKQGFYSIDDMKLFVEVKWINAEQYEDATGLKYA